MNTKNKYFKAFVMLCITVLFSVIAFAVDRQPIGLEGTSVGFSTLNGAFAGKFGYNEAFDKISDIAMGIAFLTVACFAALGLKELVQKKDISKVSRFIIGLGILYVIVAVIYVAFGKIPINYRPIIPPGETELETSFPSTHTLVICTVLGSAFLVWHRAFKNKKLVRALQIASVAIMVIGIVARALAGVHWITDIVAGILFSATLISLYVAWSLE